MMEEKSYVTKKIGHRRESNQEPIAAHDCTFKPLICQTRKCSKHNLRRATIFLKIEAFLWKIQDFVFLGLG